MIDNVLAHLARVDRDDSGEDGLRRSCHGPVRKGDILETLILSERRDDVVLKHWNRCIRLSIERHSAHRVGQQHLLVDPLVGLLAVDGRVSIEFSSVNVIVLAKRGNHVLSIAKIGGVDAENKDQYKLLQNVINSLAPAIARVSVQKVGHCGRCIQKIARTAMRKVDASSFCKIS